MIQLRVKVKQLNKRKVIPSFLPDPNNIVGVVNENFTFEGEEVTVVPNKALGKWYVDRDGHFYWEGGLDISSQSLSASIDFADYLNLPFIPERMSWAHEYYNIPFIWKELNTTGAGVVVAVIDTGIDVNNIDLKSRMHSSSRSFVKNVTSISDDNGHGTSMAGIIAAVGTDKVYGLAPSAELLILKGTVHKGGVNLNEFADAIDFASSIPEVDIVSISYSFVEQFVAQNVSLQKAIENCLKANKIVVAAIGNAHLSNPDAPTFPACYNKEFPFKDNLLAIGAFNQSGNVCTFSNWNEHLRCLAPGESIMTTDLNNTTKLDTGSSTATALTAGCLALLISYLKRNNKNINGCVPAILDSCDDIGNQIGFENGTGYGRINIRNAISKLKINHQ